MTEKRKTRSDMLRRRPSSIRYFGIAVTENGISHWTAYGALKYLVDKGVKIHSLHVADVVKGTCYLIPVPVEVFMEAWRSRYNDPDWDIAEWLKEGVDKSDSSV